MTVWRTEAFDTLCAKLQPNVRKKVEASLAKWSDGPIKYPKLEWKVVNHTERWWSIRIGDTGYRAVCLEDAEEGDPDTVDFYWFFVGSHDDYIRLLP